MAIDTDEPRRRIDLTSAALLAALVGLCAAVVLVGGALVPALGMLVVAGGLLLDPLRAAVLAALAIAATGVLLITLPIEQPWLRLGTVVIASGLAMAVAWTGQHRTRRIAELLATQEAVFDAVPEALVVLDDAGRLVDCNPACRRLIPGATRGKALHDAFVHVLADGSPCPGSCPLAAPSVAGKSVGSINGEVILVDGRHNIEYTVAPMAADHFVVSIRDVTEAVAAAGDKRALEEAASRQSEQIQLLRLIGSAGHEGLPNIADLEMDLWSRPAVGQPATGSNLVDVSTLPDGQVLFLVVAAVDGGVSGAHAAWQMLYVARTLLITGTGLDALIERADELLPQTDRAHLTAVVVDPCNGAMRMTSRGPVPALSVSPAGTTEWLPASRDGKPRVVSKTLQPGESLVLFTEGLVDGDRDAVEGLSTLRAAAAALRRRPVSGWAKALVDAVLEPEPIHATATLLLVRRGQSTGGRQTTATR